MQAVRLKQLRPHSGKQQVQCKAIRPLPDCSHACERPLTRPSPGSKLAGMSMLQLDVHTPSRLLLLRQAPSMR